MTVRDLGDNDYDVVIVGGGPAGLSAGVRCANEGVKTLLVEATDILLPKRSWLVESIAGVEKLKTLGIDETEIATNYVDQIRLTSIHDDSIITARGGFKNRDFLISSKLNKICQVLFNLEKYFQTSHEERC